MKMVIFLFRSDVSSRCVNEDFNSQDLGLLLSAVSVVYVVVQVFPWFEFYFPLFKTHYHTLPYHKTKENKI